MKDWVIPFLIQKERSHWDSKNHWSEDAKDELIRDKTHEYENSRDNVYIDLVDSLNTNFGGSLSGAPGIFILGFAYILANLEEDVFMKIYDKKNVLFAFTSHFGSEVKTFELQAYFKKGDFLKVVNFPFLISYYPSEALKGEVAHELAHVYAGHTDPSNKVEREANEIAKNWGFEKEIEAMYKFHDERNDHIAKGEINKFCSKLFKKASN